MNIDFHLDHSELSLFFRDLAANQLPFAAARALTWTGQDAQKEVKRQLPQRFELRNNWTEKGIRIKPAKKNLMEASVFTKDDWMFLQEEGGIKVPSGKRLAIPSDEWRREGGQRGVIKGKNRPKALINAMKKSNSGTRAFIATMPDGTEGIFKRRSGQRLPLDMLYVLIPDAHVGERFAFEETVVTTARERLSRNFSISLADALK